MCKALLGDTKQPKPPPLPAQLPEQPKPTDPAVQAARRRVRMSAAAASGMSGTILNGSQGLNTAAQTQNKTLLGM